MGEFQANMLITVKLKCS